MMADGGTPPLPYTPVDYIVADGTAYINTNIAGTPAKSMELKALTISSQSNSGLLGSMGSSTDGEGKKFIMAQIAYFSSDTSKHIVGAYYYLISSGSPSVADSVANGTPFVIRTSFKKSAQSIGVKQEGESSYTAVTKIYSSTVSSTLKMFLLALNNNGTAASVAESGTRLYYCKIYSDATYSTLVFDGVPCYYNGEYGIWDKVTDSFFGNVAGSGAFSGPSNS